MSKEEEMATARKSAPKAAKPIKKAYAKPAKKKAGVKAAVFEMPWGQVPTKRSVKTLIAEKTSKRSTGPRNAFKTRFVPKKALADIIGGSPVDTTELRRQLWEYVKSERLEELSGNSVRVSLNAPLKRLVKTSGGGDKGKGDDPGPSVTWSQLAKIAVKSVK
jgi:chromatin remodeling complex protein RSC6